MKINLKFFYLFFLVLLLSGCGDGRYRITLVNNNDTGNTVIKKDYEESILPPTPPIKEGYVFVGWYKDKDLTEKFDFQNMPKKNITLYAKWEPFPYNIFYHLDGGENSNLNPRMYTTLISVELSSPTKIDYNFLGWYNNELFTGEPITSIPKGSIGTIHLYAKWARTLYNIEFDCVIMENLPSIEGEYNSCIELPTPEKLEYTFLGWRLNNNIYAGGTTFYITGNLTLTAIWEGYSNGLLFTLDNNEAYIKSYTGTSTVFIIPDAIVGCPVVSIESQTFKNNKTIKTLKLGKNITSIGTEAFNSMTKLESIEFPNEATSLGASLLKGCNSLKVITFSNKANYDLKYYFGNVLNNIPSTLKVIYLTSGANPINTKLLKSNLTGMTLILPDDTTEITAEQFKNTTLKTIIIPNSVKIIGKNAFLNASSLSIYTEASFKPWRWSNTWNPDNRPVVWGYTKTVVRSDIEYALSNRKIAYVIGQSFNASSSDLNILPTVDNCLVTEIMNDAFCDNTTIRSITIPASLKHIKEGSFKNATNLTEIKFTGPSKLISIGEKAFYQCRKLTSIILPSSVNSIGPNAFRGATSLIICSKATSSPTTWDLQWNPDNRPVLWNHKKNIIINSIEYALFNDNKAYVLKQETNATTDEITILSNIEDCEVIAICPRAFYENSIIKKITIPANIETIGQYAFAYTTNLETVIFSKNSKLTALENHLFYEAVGLKNIAIPESIATINDYAFYNCYNLKSIVIPITVTNIRKYVFNATNISITVYCEAKNRPVEWSNVWIIGYAATVYWDYTIE